MSMEWLTETGVAGFTTYQLLIWGVAGIVASVLLMGRRPLGYLGDILIGVVGGLLAGVVQTRFDLAGFVRLDPVPEPWRQILLDFIPSLIGAIVVLIIIRVLLNSVFKRRA